MLNRFQLQDSSNIDAYGQNLVGQVFFEQRVCYLVVEIALKSKDAFLLKQASLNGAEQQRALAIYAKCSHCFAFDKLTFNCQCHKVNYCSKDCQMKDLRFHEEKCQGYEVIEKWDQSCKPN